MTVIEQIQKTWKDETLYIFPSEIVARFWEEKWLLHCTESVIPGGRFVSWDFFKEKNQNRGDIGLPVNQSMRWLFVEQILDQNSREPIFSHIVPLEHSSRSQSFFPFVQSILASLYHFNRQNDFFKTRLHPDLVKDLSCLYNEYMAFLKKYELFDPNYIDPDFESVKHNCVVFFPPLLEDFSEYEYAIGQNPLITTYRFSSPEQIPQLQEYDHVQNELKGCLYDVRALLIEGIAPEDIWISVGDYESVYKELKRLGKELNVPLQVRQGQSIMDMPGLRIIKLITQGLSSSYSYDSISLILSDPSINWQYPVLRILEKAAERDCVSAPTGNEWELILRDTKTYQRPSEDLCDEDERDAQFIKQLFAILKELGTTNSFVRFKELLNVIFFELSRPGSPEIEGIIRLGLAKLDSLVASELKYQLLPKNCLSFFSRVLENTSYVPQQSQRGVSVLPYRVGAGAQPEYHFCVQLNQKACSIARDLHPYLQSYEKIMAELDDMNLGAGFLEAYCQGGSNVYMSFARENYQGTQLAPDQFVLASAVSKAKDVIDPDLTCNSQYDQGYKRYINITESKNKKNYTKDGLGKDFGARLKNEKAVYSSSRLDQYLKCPYAYFLRNNCKIEEYNQNPQVQNNLAIGNIGHAFLEAAENSMVEKQDIDLVLDDVFKSQAWRINSIFPPARKMILSVLKDYLKTYIMLRLKESELNTDMKLQGLEVSGKYESDKYELDGRIDCIHESNEGAVITDFKLGTIPKKKEVLINKDLKLSQTLLKTQLPIYSLLYGVKNVNKARYYSMTKGTFTTFLGPAETARATSAEDIQAYINEFLDTLSETIEKIQNGIFQTPEDCDPCRFRSICRVKYRVQ